MKAQMCFDSKSIGGGGVFQRNSGVASSSSSSTPTTEDSVCGNNNNKNGGKVRKCKRVRRLKRSNRRHHHQHFDHDNREMRGEMIKEYLCKLQEIVPFSRKDIRLSKLEVITNAIDYIRELRETLGMPPCISSSDSISHFSSETNNLIFSQQQLPSMSSSPPFYTEVETQSLSPVEIATENCYSDQKTRNLSPEDNWGTMRPVLWKISVPCNRNDDDDSSSNDTSSMISSSSSSAAVALASDKVNCLLD